jgi:hypothetical protein
LRPATGVSADSAAVSPRRSGCWLPHRRAVDCTTDSLDAANNSSSSALVEVAEYKDEEDEEAKTTPAATDVPASVLAPASTRSSGGVRGARGTSDARGALGGARGSQCRLSWLPEGAMPSAPNPFGPARSGNVVLRSDVAEPEVRNAPVFSCICCLE